MATDRQPFEGSRERDRQTPEGRERHERAQRFFATDQRGVPDGAHDGIDYRHDVDVTILEPGDVVYRREESAEKNRGEANGRWFAPAGSHSSRLGIEGESNRDGPPSDAFVVTRRTYALRSTAADYHGEKSNGELHYGGDQQLFVRSQDRGNLCRVVDQSRGKQGPEATIER